MNALPINTNHFMGHEDVYEFLKQDTQVFQTIIFKTKEKEYEIKKEGKTQEEFQDVLNLLEEKSAAERLFTMFGLIVGEDSLKIVQGDLA